MDVEKGGGTNGGKMGMTRGDIRKNRIRNPREDGDGPAGGGGGRKMYGIADSSGKSGKGGVRRNFLDENQVRSVFAEEGGEAGEVGLFPSVVCE